MANHKLTDAKPNPRNPRKITDKKLQMLKDSLARFGDLSGMVVNQASGNQVVGGHQRLKAYQDIGVEQFVIERTYKTPTPAGTVAEGYVLVDGERHAYREVVWDKATEKAANLAANKGAGEWDFSQVTALIAELEELNFDCNLTMWDEKERMALLSAQTLKEPADKKEADVVSQMCPNCGFEY